MRSRLVVIFAVWVSCSYGQGSSSGLGSVQLPFFARSAGLGEAVVADGPSLSASILNPASLASLSSPEFSLSHQKWVQGTVSEFAASALPLPSVTLGLSVSLTTISEIPIREQPGPPIGTFAARTGIIALTGATSIDRELLFGIALKYLYEKIYVDDATGFALDAGILYEGLAPNLTVGLSITNLGAMNNLRAESSALPTHFNVGFSYEFSETPFRVKPLASASVDLRRSQTHFTSALEVSYEGFVFMRAGFLTGFAFRGITTGFGVQSNPFQLDYAFLPFSQGFGDAHLLTIGVTL